MKTKLTPNRKLKRSPLKASPLHTAGQSIDEEIGRIHSVEIATYMTTAACMVLLSAFEWYKWITSAPPSPVPITIGASIMVAYCVFKIHQYKKEVKKLKLARDGEKAVGEYLDSFREQGYRVLHDLVVGDYNIDHVIIGTTGIYTIETKTISKFVRGDQRIIYDGNEISINGFKPDRNPIIQAKAQANWVQEFVRDFVGFKVKVKPVVVFPGWYIEGNTKAEVWVLEPKALKSFLQNRHRIIDESNIPIIASNLTRYLRASEKLR